MRSGHPIQRDSGNVRERIVFLILWFVVSLGGFIRAGFHWLDEQIGQWMERR